VQFALLVRCWPSQMLGEFEFAEFNLHHCLGGGSIYQEGEFTRDEKRGAERLCLMVLSCGMSDSHE